MRSSALRRMPLPFEKEYERSGHMYHTEANEEREERECRFVGTDNRTDYADTEPDAATVPPSAVARRTVARIASGD